jgi:hypothetical protein
MGSPIHPNIMGRCFTKSYTQNTNEILEITDIAYNSGGVLLFIDRIDKTAPTISNVTSYPTTPTS